MATQEKTHLWKQKVLERAVKLASYWREEFKEHCVDGWMEYFTVGLIQDKELSVSMRAKNVTINLHDWLDNRIFGE